MANIHITLVKKVWVVLTILYNNQKSDGIEDSNDNNNTNKHPNNGNNKNKVKPNTNSVDFCNYDSMLNNNAHSSGTSVNAITLVTRQFHSL